MARNKDKYKYLLDLADEYLGEMKELMEKQQQSWNELRQERIEYLNRKAEEVLSDYEKFHMQDEGYK